MTLDERIEEDLKQLYNNGEISGAIELYDLVKTDKSKYDELEKLAKTPKDKDTLKRYMMDQTSFATRALPIYDGGKRDAKTVMVMLNPGNSVENSNKELLHELKKRNMHKMFRKLSCGNACPQVNLKNDNLDDDIKHYNDFNANYGNWDRWRMDNFDLKQAFFLREWKEDTGIVLPNELSADSDLETLLEAKRRVLMEKRQLELVPYASSRFNAINKNSIKKLFPYVETLFDEIFRYDRKYVIFCSRKFAEVFEAYKKDYPKSIDFVSYKEEKGFKGSKLSVSCRVICIRYGGKEIKAIIANTFPNQALPNAYELMAAYGKFCYDELLKATKKIPDNKTRHTYVSPEHSHP